MPSCFLTSGIATGGSRGVECHPWQRKICQKSGKRGKKSGKIGEKEEKSGRKDKNREGSFTLPLPTDRAGYATVFDLNNLWFLSKSSDAGVPGYPPVNYMYTQPGYINTCIVQGLILRTCRKLMKVIVVCNTYIYMWHLHEVFAGVGGGGEGLAPWQGLQGAELPCVENLSYLDPYEVILTRTKW